MISSAWVLIFSFAYSGETQSTTVLEVESREACIHILKQTGDSANACVNVGTGEVIRVNKK